MVQIGRRAERAKRVCFWQPHMHKAATTNAARVLGGSKRVSKRLGFTLINRGGNRGNAVLRQQLESRAHSRAELRVVLYTCGYGEM